MGCGRAGVYMLPGAPLRKARQLLRCGCVYVFGPGCVLTARHSRLHAEDACAVFVC